MNTIDWKQVFISIFIGALVAFFTALFEGILDFLNGSFAPATGGAATAVWYIIKRALV